MKLPPEATPPKPAPSAEQIDLELRSGAAHAGSQRTFRTQQDCEWRNIVAAELNTVLARVGYEMETCLPPDIHDVEFAEAALSLVRRVANFEKIEREKPE